MGTLAAMSWSRLDFALDSRRKIANKLPVHLVRALGSNLDEAHDAIASELSPQAHKKTQKRIVFGFFDGHPVEDDDGGGDVHCDAHSLTKTHELDEGDGPGGDDGDGPIDGPVRPVRVVLVDSVIDDDFAGLIDGSASLRMSPYSSEFL